MLLKTLKHYPLSLLSTAVLLYVSLMPVPEVELQDVPFIDKWAHMLLYLGYGSCLWLEHLRAQKGNLQGWSAWLTVAWPIALGGLIELLQAYATTCRSGDWMDALANGVGAAGAVLVGRFVLRPLLKR